MRLHSLKLDEYLPDNLEKIGHFEDVSLLALLPPNRRPKVEAWLLNLEHSKSLTDPIVAHHWRTDAHLPSEAAAALADVVEHCSPGGGCQILCSPGIPPSVWMRPPSFRPAPEGAAMLVRFCQLKRLKHFAGRDGSGVIEACTTAQEAEMAIQNLDVREFAGELRGAGPINWCAPASDIPDDDAADDVRDRLGLSHFTLAPKDTPKPLLEEIVVELRYQAGVPASLHVPTVAEAAGYEPFLPAPSPAESGFTQHLATGRRSSREFVHGPIKAGALSEVRCRGRLQSNPPADWIDIRLAAIRAENYPDTA